MDLPAIRINGLGAYQVAQLKHSFGDSVTTTESSTVIQGAHGEMATLSLLVALSPAIIGTLGVWLAKSRKREDIDFEFETRRPDGTWEKTHIKLAKKESMQPDASLVSQLAKMTGQSADAIKQAIEQQLASKQ